MKTIEAKIKIKIKEAIEAIFDDDEVLNEFLQETDYMIFCDSYADRMADAATSVLFGMADLYSFLKEQGDLK
jgi:hypothetical protein